MPTPTPEMLLTIARKLGQSISGKTGFIDQAMKGLGDNPRLAQYLQAAMGHATVPSHLSGVLEQPDLLQAAAAHFTEALKPHLYGSTAKNAIQAHIKSIPTPQNPGPVSEAASTGQIPDRFKALLEKVSPRERAVIDAKLQGGKMPLGGGEGILQAMRTRLGLGGGASKAPTKATGPHVGRGHTKASTLPQGPQPALPGMENLPETLAPGVTPVPPGASKVKRTLGPLEDSIVNTYGKIMPPQLPSSARLGPQQALRSGKKQLDTSGLKKTPIQPRKPKPEVVEDLASRRARALLAKRKEIK